MAGSREAFELLFTECNKEKLDFVFLFDLAIRSGSLDIVERLIGARCACCHWW